MLSGLLFLSTAYADNSFGITPWTGATFQANQGGESITGDGSMKFGSCNASRGEIHVSLPTHLFDGQTDASVGTYTGHLGLQWFAGRAAPAYAAAQGADVDPECLKAKVLDGVGSGFTVQ